MISSYHSYVDYFNKLIMLTSHKPESIEYLNKVNDVDVLTAIEDIDKAILNLREKILVVESEIHNLILAKIISKEIVIEKFTIGYILKDFFSMFKIKNKFKPKTYIATLQEQIMNNAINIDNDILKRNSLPEELWDLVKST